MKRLLIAAAVLLPLAGCVKPGPDGRPVFHITDDYQISPKSIGFGITVKW